MFGNSEQLLQMARTTVFTTKKPFMGLTNFPGEEPSKKDIGIAKNYLDENELKILNNLVSGYFDFAEIQAMRRNPMYMSDYISHLDALLVTAGEKLLEDAGSVSHQQAMDKAQAEYKEYQKKMLTAVEKDYLDAVKSIENDVKTARNKDKPSM